MSASCVPTRIKVEDISDCKAASTNEELESRPTYNHTERAQSMEALTSGGPFFSEGSCLVSEITKKAGGLGTRLRNIPVELIRSIIHMKKFRPDEKSKEAVIDQA